MREVDEDEAKKHFLTLVRAVEETGEAALITRAGRVVARLSPIAVPEDPQAPRRLLGMNLVERFRQIQETAALANRKIDDLS